jgi:hypothetical protein
MTDNKKEPARPSPSPGSTLGIPWDKLSEKEFEEKEREMRENIRTSGDYF